jgi:hypothetical protein
VIGTSKRAESITAARIATLPAKERGAWTAYLERSAKQMQVDKATLAAERTAGSPEPATPKEGFSARTMPLNRDAAWYGTRARHIAGGRQLSDACRRMGKNLDMAFPEAWTELSRTISKHPSVDDFDTPKTRTGTTWGARQ